MKSVAIKGKEKLEVVEIEDPTAKAGNVVIKVTKAGICGSDLHYYEAGGPMNLVMGHEYCGVVIDHGSRQDLKTGDRVTALPISPCGDCPACRSANPQYCPQTWTNATGLAVTNPGAFAEKMSVRPDMVIKVPETVTDEEVAMVEPTAVGLHAIHLADIQVGDKVLVIGGGIIGQVIAMFAKMEGASYVALSETNQKRGKKALSLGVCDEWFDAKAEDVINTMYQKTNGGFDKVLECCGNAPAITTAMTVAKPGGLVILVGVSMEAVMIHTTLAVMRELTLKGSIAYTKDEFETCITLMENKQINMKRFIDDIVGLNETQHAFERLFSGEDDAIKILVDPNK